VRQAGERKRSLRERDETDDIVVGEQRRVGVCLMAHDPKRKKCFDTRKTHQSKSLLAIFIKYDTQPFQIDNSRTFAELAQKTINGIDMCFWLYPLMHQLIERDDGVSYFLIKKYHLSIC